MAQIKPSPISHTCRGPVPSWKFCGFLVGLQSLPSLDFDLWVPLNFTCVSSLVIILFCHLKWTLAQKPLEFLLTKKQVPGMYTRLLWRFGGSIVNSDYRIAKLSTIIIILGITVPCCPVPCLMDHLLAELSVCCSRHHVTQTHILIISHPSSLHSPELIKFFDFILQSNSAYVYSAASFQTTLQGMEAGQGLPLSHSRKSINDIYLNNKLK